MELSIGLDKKLEQFVMLAHTVLNKYTPCMHARQIVTVGCFASDADTVDHCSFPCATGGSFTTQLLL